MKRRKIPDPMRSSMIQVILFYLSLNPNSITETTHTIHTQTFPGIMHTKQATLNNFG